jgi:predicted phage-related endonuclease
MIEPTPQTFSSLPPAQKILSEQHWHELRSKTVGASEVAALFDASPYLTKFELWHRKKGNLSGEFEDDERKFWGRKLEPAIAAGVAEQRGWKLIKPEGYYFHPTVAGMGCTPDFLIDDPVRGLGAMEVKNIDYLQFRCSWTGSEPPLCYILQLQDQLACTGVSWGCIAALVAGNDPAVFIYDRHEQAIARIEQAVTAFWKSIADNIEPPVVSEDYEIIRELYPSAFRPEIDLTADNQLPALCADALMAQAQRMAAEKREKQIKAEIINRLKDAEAAKCSGFFIRYPEIVKHMKATEATTQKYRQLTIRKEEFANV